MHVWPPPVAPRAVAVHRLPCCNCLLMVSVCAAVVHLIRWVVLRLRHRA